MLQERDFDILACIQAEAATPLTVLAEQLGIKEYVLRDSIRVLTEKQVILGKKAFIDLYSLGYLDLTIFFSVSPSQFRALPEFLNSLQQNSSVRWVARIGGDYQYAVAIIAPSTAAYLQVIQDISKNYGDLLTNKTLSSRTAFTYYFRRYFSKNKKTLKKGSFSYSSQTTHLTPLQEKIVNFLANNFMVGQREMAKELHVPLSSLNREYQELVDRKLLPFQYYIINCERYGYFGYRVLLYLRKRNQSTYEKIRKFCESEPHVVYLVECFGEWDGEIGIEVESAAKLSQIVQLIYSTLQNELEKIKLLQFFSQLKTT